MDKQKILELTNNLKKQIIDYENVNGYEKRFNKMLANIKKIEDEVKSEEKKPENKEVPEPDKKRFTAQEILRETDFPFDYYENNKGKFYIIKEEDILKLINRGINEGKSETISQKHK